jgi:hypothetical protein
MPITTSTLHHNAPSSPSQALLYAHSSRLRSDINEASGAADFVTPQKTKFQLQGDAAMLFSSSLVDQRNEDDEKEHRNRQMEQPTVARRGECFHADLRSCEDITSVDDDAVRNNNNNNNDASASRSSHHASLRHYSEYMATEFVTAAGRPICIVRRSRHYNGAKGSVNVTTTSSATSAPVSSAARGLMGSQPDALPLDPAAAAAREGAFFVTSSASEAAADVRLRVRDKLALAAMPHNEKRRLSLIMPPLRWLDAPRHVDNDSSHQDQEGVEEKDADTQKARMNHDDNDVVATPFAAAGRWKRPRAASDSDLGGGHDCCDDVDADAIAALPCTVPPSLRLPIVASPHHAHGEATRSPPRHLNIAAHFSGFTTAKGDMIFLADQ